MNNQASKPPQPVGPLAGMTVLDLTQIMAGPFCTMLLADMGAEVVKVERPGGGDDSRRLGPPFVAPDGPSQTGGESTAFLGLNRNKKSVVLDLKTPRAVEVVRRMAAKADVLVENWRPGTMESLGLGYRDLSALNPALVYCSITGFGLTGPYSQRGGFDLVAQGMSGLMSITGHPDQPPVKVGVPIADLNAGALAAYGVLSAYIHRLKTGRGQYLETSLLEAALSYTVYESMLYLNAGHLSGPLGSSHRLAAPYQALRTKDGYINVGAANQANWERFAKVIGREELLVDARFRVNSDRMQNLGVLVPELERTLVTRTRSEWLEALEKAGVPAGPIYDMAEVWADEHVLARGMRAEAPHASLGQVSHIGVPVKMSDTPASVRIAAPVLGQHTDEVLAWSGYSPAEIASLRRDKVAG
ncbi:MAG: CoA transferase [Dehalococcoidia bacterium]|nr:CoA transferase [Dehalococcoidia bacterium]MSQ35287.1 CoA transferase [Dehalococcoidia bacterium]